MGNAVEDIARAPFDRRKLLAVLGVGVVGGAIGTFPALADAPPAYAAETDIEALRRRINEVAVYVSATNFPDIDPTGVKDSAAGLRAALLTVPPFGSAIIAPGTYKLSTSINGKTKNISLYGYGVTLVQSSKTNLIYAAGVWGATFKVSKVEKVDSTGSNPSGTIVSKVSKLTTTASTGFKEGDLVKVFSDDLIPEARKGTLGLESRIGEYAVVHKVSGTSVTLAGRLREPYTTGVRVAKAPTDTMRVYGFTVKTDDAGLANGYGSSLLYFTGMHRLLLEDIQCPQAGNPVIQFSGCFGWRVDRLDVGYAVNDTSVTGALQLGYGIMDNSGSMGTMLDANVRYNRHVYTDDTARIAAQSTAVTNYGRSYGHKIISCHSISASGMAFDTHHASEGIQFIDCTASNGGPSAAAFGLRGKRHQVINGHAQTMDTGVYVYNEGDKGGESYGHVIENFTAVDIARTALAFSVHPAGHSLANKRDTQVNAYVDGATIVGAKVAITAYNTLAFLKNIHFETSTGEGDAETNFVRNYNSDLSVEDSTVDARKNAFGTMRYVVSAGVTGQTEPNRTALRRVRVLQTKSVADRVNKLLHGSNHIVILKDVSWSYPFGIMPGDFMVGSSLNWTCEYDAAIPRSDLSSSFLYYASDEITKGMAAVWAADEKETMVQLDPKGKTLILPPFPKGNIRGRRINFWVVGSGSITIPNGTAQNVTNLTTKAKVITNGMLIPYFWSGTSWREAA